MNMYLHELKVMRKSAIKWTLGLIALSAMFLSIYPSMSSDAEGYKKILSNYPEQIRAALGINLNYITSILGFYSMIFSFIVLCGAIQAMNMGLSILSKEGREKTADFLLVKPVSRASIVSSKLLAGLTTIIVTDIIFYLITLIIVNCINNHAYDAKKFFMINLTLLFVQLIFMALGTQISVFMSKLKSVLPISLGVVFGSYLIGAFVTVGKDDIIRYLSPFRYFDITYIIKNSRYEVSYLIATIFIVVVSIIGSYMIYIKKDIHAV